MSGQPTSASGGTGSAGASDGGTPTTAASDRDEELAALLALQEADTAIRRLEKQLDELPEQEALDEVVEEAEKAATAEDAALVDLERVESEIRRLEGDLEMLQQRHADEQQRMYGGDISNPKELRAVRAEIDDVAERIDEREDQLLEVMERREELENGATTLQQRQAELATEQEKLTEKRDAAAKETLAKLGEVKAERDDQHGRISDDLLERYETSKERHAGVGVGQLDDGICTACRLELTPREMSDLRTGDALGTCPQCQRLIVAK